MAEKIDSAAETPQDSQRFPPRRRIQPVHEEFWDINHPDFNKVYDKTIRRGCNYQAMIPKVQEQPGPFIYKIYGFGYNKPTETSSHYLQTITKNTEQNLIVTVPRRKIAEQIEWDPEHSSDDFKFLSFQMAQYIKQNYKLDLTDHEVREYYRICRMNRGIFLASIYSDHSPFLEFVRHKRQKAKN